MAAASKTSDAETAPAKKSSGLVVALIILTLLAGGAGGGLGYLLAGKVEEVVTAKAAAEPEKTEKPLRHSGDLTAEGLKPVVVNLAAPSNTFVRIEAAIIFKNGALSNPQAAAAEIREDIMAYMRTISLSQLEGPSALQHLREDLNERVATRTEGKVTELVLETLVVQ